MEDARIDMSKENEAYEYLLYSIEKRWGKDGIVAQTAWVDALIADLKAMRDRFGRDWHIDMDAQTGKIFENVAMIPFISPFALFCTIAPDDLEARKVISVAVSSELEKFFYQLATRWTAKAREELGNQLFTCDVIEAIYGRWCYYRRVDAVYEREKHGGKNTNIRDLRKNCLKIETIQDGAAVTKEIKMDFGPAGGSIVLRFTEGGGKRSATLEVTLVDRAFFDAFANRELDTRSCDLIRLLKKEGRQAAFFANGSEHNLILKCGAEKKQFKIDLKSRYEPARDSIASRLTRQYGGSEEDQYEMTQVGDTALFQAALSGTRGENISEHLYYSVLRAIQHGFEGISTVSGCAERVESGESARVLNSKIERSGGELDSVKTGPEGFEVSTLEWLEGKNAQEGYDLYGQTLEATPEDILAEKQSRLAKRQLLEKVIRDDKDRRIIEQLAESASQIDISRELGISAPAVHKRINKIFERARHTRVEQ